CALGRSSPWKRRPRRVGTSPPRRSAVPPLHRPGMQARSCRAGPIAPGRRDSPPASAAGDPRRRRAGRASPEPAPAPLPATGSPHESQSCPSVLRYLGNFIGRPSCQGTVERYVNGVLDEADRTVGHREKHAAGMLAVEIVVVPPLGNVVLGAV